MVPQACRVDDIVDGDVYVDPPRLFLFGRKGFRCCKTREVIAGDKEAVRDHVVQQIVGSIDDRLGRNDARNCFKSPKENRGQIRKVEFGRFVDCVCEEKGDVIENDVAFVHNPEDAGPDVLVPQASNGLHRYECQKGKP